MNYNIEHLGLSHSAFMNLLSFKSMPEFNTIELLLENTEIIQLLQDYLGNEIRNKEHFAFEGVKDTLDKSEKILEWADFQLSSKEIYDILKIKEINEELKKIKKKNLSKIKKQK